MIALECAIVLVSLVLALSVPSTASGWLNSLEASFVRIAHRRRLAVLLSGVTALALRSALLPILPIPYPWIPDEMSYLLQADTFAHGRLTNPPHPLWVHFETPNVIQWPTYSSMYYPAQSTFMALGQVVVGHPFWGVWLSVGVMCAAICWMLQAWVSAPWALVGGLLCAVRLGACSYWSNSYFGGAVTAIGGALVLGSLPRLKAAQRTRDAILMGAGFALLLNSRPYETLFFSVPLVLCFALWISKSNPQGQRIMFSRVALPFALVLAITLGFMLYFFWRTTGNPLLAPYVLNLRSYAVEPNFAWLPLRPAPQYHNEIIRRYWTEWDVNTYYAVRSHPFVSTVFKIFMFWLFYLGPLLTLPLVVFGFIRKSASQNHTPDISFRFLLFVCMANLIGVLLVVPLTPLYLAPSTAAIYGMVVIAMRRVRSWSVAGKPSGVFLTRAIPIAAVVLLMVRVAIPIFHFRIFNPQGSWTWSASWNQLLSRKQVEDQLRALPAQQLVIVRCGPEHDPKEVWVSNSADIDGSKIVWAHDMGAKANAELLRHYAGRQVWLVNPDKQPIRTVSYNTVAAGG
jgi:hypothetical protein